MTQPTPGTEHFQSCGVKPASEMIWAHDNEKLQTALSFYRTVSEKTGITDWDETQALFSGKSNAALDGGDPELWQRCVESHRGMQLGLNLLTIIPRVGLRAVRGGCPIATSCVWRARVRAEVHRSLQCARS